MTSGDALSWRLRTYWKEGEWFVESDVSRITAAGSDVEFSLPTRFATDDDLHVELLGAARQLAQTVKSVRLS